jgi:hypothetical protein
MNTVCTFPFQLANKIRIQKYGAKINVRGVRRRISTDSSEKREKLEVSRSTARGGNLNVIRSVYRDFNQPLTQTYAHKTYPQT